MEKRIPPHCPGCPVDPELNDDEERIANLIALGWTRVEIGVAIGMSPETVKDHTDRLRTHHELHAERGLREHEKLRRWLAEALGQEIPPQWG